MSTMKANIFVYFSPLEAIYIYIEAKKGFFGTSKLLSCSLVIEWVKNDDNDNW